MSSISAPVDRLKSLVQEGSYRSSTLDWDVLDKLGCFVLENAFGADSIDHLAESYFKDLGTEELKKADFHLTRVDIGPEHRLRDVLKLPEFVALASHFFRGNVGSDFVRVVKKDAINKEAVFLHQDSGYQIGSLDRYSLFIALTACTPSNGGLILFPGTHNFGYLGDAGELRNILPPSYPTIETQAAPGDVVIMNSAIWHRSRENSDLTSRVYLEVHIQDIDEPNTRYEICGERRSEWRIEMTEDEIFANSRKQRLDRLYAELKQQRA